VKLLLCTDCADVFKLSAAMTACDCGRTRGRYLDDGLHAEVFGEHALVIGLDNHGLARAIDAHFDYYPEDNLSIAAWIMAEPARNVTYHRE